MLKVLRPGLPIVEHLSGLSGSMFGLFRSPQVHFSDKISKCLNCSEIYLFSFFPGFVLGSCIHGIRDNFESTGCLKLGIPESGNAGSA